MLPIILSCDSVRIGLAGAGEGRARREATLTEAGISPVLVDPEGELHDISILFVAGLAPRVSAVLAGRARRSGLLVNVEDVPELCDFHIPAIVRRGDLVLTASTGGMAPGLSRRLREWLEERFGPEWSGRLKDVGAARQGWRESGLPAGEIVKRMRDMIAQNGWLH